MKQTLSILTAVFAVLAFLVSCGGSEGSGSGSSGNNDSGETGSIYGIVTDKATGEQIINAGVELQPVGLKTVTGSDGQFEFNEVAVGTYTLFITKTGYVETSSSITVNSGKQAKGDVQLEKAPAALRIVNDNGKDISEIDFGEKLADVSRQFNIFNDGYEKLEWELSFSAEWIKSVSKEGGELKAGGTQGVIVNIDRNLLESGENVTTIHITSNDGNKQLTVKATNATVLPTLNTLETTNITSSTAVLNAEILTKGVPSYSERGFVYALESNPTLENTIAQLTAKVTEENLYSATVTGLELGEEYYVRGYAINEAGVAYSTNEVKFSPEMDLPNVTTEEATNIDLDSESATFNGTIVDEGDPAYTERGFVYGFTHNPSVDNTKIEVIGSGLGKFSANVTELEVGSIYYIRAYAINNKGVAYGSDVMLDLNGTVPQVKTGPATDLNIEAGTAVFHGEIEYLGDPIYSERGFVYNINHNPTTDDSKVVVSGTSEGEYSSDVDGLVVGNIYYVRVFATNAQGTAYGDEVEVDFGELKPQVTTGEATNINLGAGTATLNGTIVSVGDPAYTERGFVYATVHNPTVEENADTKKVVPGTDSGAFSINVSGLELNTLYYVRAYATNSQGTVYGAEKELDMTGTLPVVTTAAVSGISIEAGTATFKGTIEELGDPAYTERGFVYGLTHNPTIDDTKRIVSGNASGVFSANISELVRNKIYYIRAYATNAVGTSYGEEVVLDFTAVMPVVNTSAVTAKNIGAGTATFNGTIVSVGDPAYTERGFVYGLTHNPTIDDMKKVVSGNASGVFSANISELVMNKIYYIRAYATNAVGTSYGEEVVLDFNAVMPVVTTSAVTAKNIGAGSATFNGSITSVGDPVYTERGFVYGLTHSPTIDDTKKVVSGSGTGTFSANVTELSVNKIYYIRAYATNVQGTVYGSEVSADFSAVMPVLTTSAVTSISIGGGTATFNGSITSVGDPAYTERGFVYGTVHNPTVENADTDTGDTDTLPECSSTSGTPCKDSSSGLVWSAKASTTYTWQNAVDYCNSYSEGGYSDWKLPNIDELRTLLIASRVSANCQASETNGCLSSSCWTCSTCTESCTPASSGTDCDSCQPYSDGRFSKLGDGNVYLWSSSTRSDDTGRAWYVSFPSGNVNNYYKTSSNYVRCVRYSQSDTGSADTDIAARKKVVPGSGTGAFSASVTNLEMNKTYYIRAYATNLQGTAYGNEETLNFNPVSASVKTNSVSNIDATTATLNGSITALGDPKYTEKGFVYAKTPNPTIALSNKVTVSGSGIGTFIYDLTGLETQVIYYVKAYVISNNNIYYGNEISFFTESPYYYILKSAGFMVAKEYSGRFDWNSALEYCNGYEKAGFSDWRLPTFNELMIVYNNKDSIGIFPDDDRLFRSSSRKDDRNSYSIDFLTGGKHSTGDSGLWYVCCVRNTN